MTVVHDSAEDVSADTVPRTNSKPGAGATPAKRGRRRRKRSTIADPQAAKIVDAAPKNDATPSDEAKPKSRKRPTQDEVEHTPQVDLPDNLTDLQQDIDQKDAVIQVLTSQLEQAAERLDRIHRTGSDRQIRMPQVPDELVGQQQELLDELHEAVRHLEESQSTLMLERIQREVSEVRDMISDGVHSGTFRPATSAGKANNGAPRASGEEPSLAAALSQAFGAPPALDLAEPTNSEETAEVEEDSANEEENEVDGLSSETMSLLRSLNQKKVPEPDSTNALENAKKIETRPEDSRSTSSNPDDPQVDAATDFVEPQAIDFDSVDRDELIRAIEERDSLVSVLIHKLRASERLAAPAGNWSELADTPDELRMSLEALERRLDTTARLAEMDLSMERARLARESSRLQVLEQRLRVREEAVAQSTADAEDGTTKANRRWLRFLGRRDDA